jgi:uncharacterized protein YqgC (DUF456 family)
MIPLSVLMEVVDLLAKDMTLVSASDKIATMIPKILINSVLAADCVADCYLTENAEANVKANSYSAMLRAVLGVALSLSGAQECSEAEKF